MTKISININAVIDAMEMTQDQITYYLDSETGETFFIMGDFLDGEYEDENDANIRKVENDKANRYREISTLSSHEGYECMEKFADTVISKELGKKLAIALNGKGAFRRFKDVLLDYPDERDRWFQFEKETIANLAKEWLESEKVAW